MLRAHRSSAQKTSRRLIILWSICVAVVFRPDRVDGITRNAWGRSGLLRDQVISAQRRSHQFYIGLTLFLMATVVVGFWPSYFGTLLGGGVARPLVMHVHGAIFTGWMLLLLLQVGLASTGRVRLHRRVGTFGIGYGVVVWVMGVIAMFAAPVIHVRNGEWPLDQAAGFLILPIGDMILFAGSSAPR